MKKCPFCAEEIQDEAIKCKYCGEMLIEMILCNHCGEKNPENNLFCDKCGWGLKLEVKKENVEKNKLAIAGFVLGILSIFLGGEFSLFPISAIIFSSYGIYYTKAKFNKRGRWMAILGLILGVLYLIVNLFIRKDI